MTKKVINEADAIAILKDGGRIHVTDAAVPKYRVLDKNGNYHGSMRRDKCMELLQKKILRDGEHSTLVLDENAVFTKKPIDYKKAAEWERQRYVRAHLKLDKASGEALHRILEHRGLALMEWVREKIRADDPAPPDAPQPQPRKYQHRKK